MSANRTVERAVSRELDALRGTSPGGRARATFKAAAALGRWVGAGALAEEEAFELLSEAAVETGLTAGEAGGHIRNGLRVGALTPRRLPASVKRADHGSREERLALFRSPGRELLPKRPPISEVEEVWNKAEPVCSDPEAVAWLESRSLRAPSIEDWDLARVLRPDQRLPRWGWSKGGTWIQSGHRLLFRAWDAQGRAASLRARCLRADPPVAKSLAPAGSSARGLVLADPLGVQLLQGEMPDWWSPRQIAILEGETDWLARSTLQSDSQEQGPVCFGIAAGSWTTAIAERIPQGAQVLIRTDLDHAGESYARAIDRTLRGKCEIRRLDGEVVS